MSSLYFPRILLMLAALTSSSPFSTFPLISTVLPFGKKENFKRSLAPKDFFRRC